MFKGLQLDPLFLEKENVVAKLQLLMQLEKSSPYAKGSVFDPLRERILRALRAVPGEHQKYVLALFANTIYCTEQFSTSIMLHLYNTVLHQFRISPNKFADQCLVLEVDPTGMINDFLRLNKVQGRLNKMFFPREQQLDNFVNKVVLKNGLDNFLDGGGGSEDNSATVKEILEKAKFTDDSHQLRKKYWIILTDNALSGTSLCSSVDRMWDLADQKNENPTVVILIRTLTEQARNLIKARFSDKLNSKSMFVHYGLLLRDDYAIKSGSGCKLFNDKETKEGIIRASEWLAGTSEYINDDNLTDHKTNSGDDLYLGFKKCGLTFVSAENCPSNSLPLLWYKKDGFYEAPFPRVLSRI